MNDEFLDAMRLWRKKSLVAVIAIVISALLGKYSHSEICMFFCGLFKAISIVVMFASVGYLLFVLNKYCRCPQCNKIPRALWGVGDVLLYPKACPYCHSKTDAGGIKNQPPYLR